MTDLYLSIPREWPPLEDVPCRHCAAPARDILGLCTACEESLNLELGIRYRRHGITWETVRVVPVGDHAVHLGGDA